MYVTNEHYPLNCESSSWNYLMRKGQASRTQRVTSMNLIPAEEKGGQVQAMRLRMLAASSSLRYICVCVFNAQHTCKEEQAGICQV